MMMSLEAMRAIDVRNVDPHTLVDRRSVQVDASLPQGERLQQYIQQIKNPYCYLDDGIVVKVSFAGTKETIEDRLEAYIRSM